MSIKHLNQAFDAQIKKSTHKFILVALADYANEVGEAYPSTETICNKTSLDRKTVLAGLIKLTELKFIIDTGQKKGKTHQVRVWLLTIDEGNRNSAENGTLKPSQKRNHPENGTVPFLRGKSPENGMLEPSQKRDIEPSVLLTIREPPDIRQKKKFVKPSVEEVAEYCKSRRNHVCPERFHAYYESNGWKTGKNPVKDWKASVRYWETNSGGSHASNKQFSQHSSSADRAAATLERIKNM